MASTRYAVDLTNRFADFAKGTVRAHRAAAEAFREASLYAARPALRLELGELATRYDGLAVIAERILAELHVALDGAAAFGVRLEAQAGAGAFRPEAGPCCPGCGLPALLGCDCKPRAAS